VYLEFREVISWKMKEKCSFPGILRGHLCFLPLVTGLLGLGLILCGVCVLLRRDFLF
jgi:hypothetical protein